MARKPIVLIVDDEAQIQRVLKLGLGAGDFKVLSARTAEEALRVFEEEEIDVILLDIGLPDRSGLDVLKEIRGLSPVPVVILSVRESETDKVRAFELGADDYVTKPFGMAELTARLRVALKHRLQTEGTQPTLKLGDIEIDLVNRRVRRAGREVILTKTEFDILRLLAKHPGEVLTHDFILSNVRGTDGIGNPQYLRVYVRALRSKLGERAGENKVIRTEMGIGYRLVAPWPEAVAASPS